MSNFHATRTHPGFLAPASLKAALDGRHTVRITHSSGVSCPGLIEGAATPRPARRSGMTHPGFLAPASLKDRTQCQLDPRPPAHPGFLAPASLKADVFKCGVRGGAHSSGVSCPGLIEGICPAPRTTRSACSSGVSCPGLIEGVTSDDGQTNEEELIRGFLPRPH